MRLSDQIREAGKPRARGCVICLVTDTLDTEDQKDLVECLADESISAAAIARVLKERGYPVHPEGKQVRRHRRECV